MLQSKFTETLIGHDEACRDVRPPDKAIRELYGHILCMPFCAHLKRDSLNVCRREKCFEKKLQRRLTQMFYVQHTFTVRFTASELRQVKDTMRRLHFRTRILNSSECAEHRPIHPALRGKGKENQEKIFALLRVFWTEVSFMISI